MFVLNEVHNHSKLQLQIAFIPGGDFLLHTVHTYFLKQKIKHVFIQILL